MDWEQAEKLIICDLEKGVRITSMSSGCPADIFKIIKQEFKLKVLRLYLVIRVSRLLWSLFAFRTE